MFIFSGRRFFTPVAVIIISLSVILIGGIVVWRYLGLPEKETTLEVREGLSSEEAPEGNTAEWKTYRNEEYEYEVKYPKDWIAEIDDGISLMPKGFDKDKRDMMLRIDPANVGRESAFDFIAQPELVAGSFENIVFAGKQAKQYVCGPPCHLNEYYSKAIRIIDTEGTKWERPNEIGYRVRTKNYEYLIPKFEQILSTFRFL